MAIPKFRTPRLESNPSQFDKQHTTVKVGAWLRSSSDRKKRIQEHARRSHVICMIMPTRYSPNFPSQGLRNPFVCFAYTYFRTIIRAVSGVLRAHLISLLQTYIRPIFARCLKLTEDTLVGNAASEQSGFQVCGCGCTGVRHR